MITAREATGVLLLTLFAVGGCGKGSEGGKQPEQRAGELVRVGNAVLTGADVDRLVPEDEQTSLTFEERRDLVRRWVDTEVLYQEAVHKGLKTDPYVEARLKEFEQQFLADYLLFTELRKRTRVSAEEIEAYYAAHEREYAYEYRVSQILVSTPEEAEKVKKLLETKSWAWVASRYSTDTNGQRGGDLGYLTKGNMIPELEAIIFDMKPGETSDATKSDFGYHIFRLEDVRAALVAVSLDEVREQIMTTLMLEKRKEAYGAFIDSLRSCANVRYKDASYLGKPETAAKTDTIIEEVEFDTTGAHRN
ncbi:MAG: peptidyl-prolyl cis-trans isomerase [Candidatus Krumholzibacteria bacterium]|nr:peptidyl-prolyl cis-trans isomerase [Candidatus Krumholzibacteria bacterium]